MRILVYKRTHIGDPNQKRQFGCHGCMGRVRSYNYDAVIGIGAMHPWKGHDISGKITWIGGGSKKLGNRDGDPNPVVTFEKFALHDENGPLAPPSLHPARLPRYIILYEGREGYEDAYQDAKSIIDRLMSGELNHNINDETASETEQERACSENCRGMKK